MRCLAIETTLGTVCLVSRKLLPVLSVEARLYVLSTKRTLHLRTRSGPLTRPNCACLSLPFLCLSLLLCRALDQLIHSVGPGPEESRGVVVAEEKMLTALHPQQARGAE